MTKLRSLLLFGLLLSLFTLFSESGPVTVAHAAPKPDPNAAAIAVLATAQNIYIQESDLYFGDDPRYHYPYPSPNFVAFYNGFQAFGRYQLLPSITGADLVLRYVDNGLAREVDIIDPKTLSQLGKFWASKGRFTQSNADRLQIVANILGQFQKNISGSSSHTPTLLPLPAKYPAIQNTTPILAQLSAAPKVFIVDRGLPAGFPAPKKSPYQPGELAGILKADIAARYHLQPVDTLAEADFIFTLSGVSGMDTTNIGNYEDGRDYYLYSLKNNTFLVLDIADARSLRQLASGIKSPVLKPMKGLPDPKNITIINLVDHALHNIPDGD